MVWHRTGIEPLPGPMMTQFNDTLMHHRTPLILWHVNVRQLLHNQISFPCNDIFSHVFDSQYFGGKNKPYQNFLSYGQSQCTEHYVQQWNRHNNDVIMSAMASQIIGVSSVCPTVGSGADQRKHQSSASLAFVRGIHRWPVNSPHKTPVTRKIFPFDDVIMKTYC